MSNLVQIFIIIIVINSILVNVTCINSYIYLPDKLIQEELPIGSLIVDLNEELINYYNLNNQQQQQSMVPLLEQQFTFLEDLKSKRGSNTYFLLDSITGHITTKRNIDRESMCLNRHCMDTCADTQVPSIMVINRLNTASSLLLPTVNQTVSNLCKLNVKVLLMPSSNIISLNIVIDDINDNRPQFRKEFLNQTITENVPVGYKIPIDLAYDADIGRNAIQYYELIELNTNFQIIQETFELKQNLNELQLALIIKKKLDRELQSTYNFSIVAHDGGMPPFSGKLDCFIQILDINDNNPQFDKDVFKFTLPEDTPIGTQVGYIHATDLDEGLNAKIKYSLVGSVINSNVNGVYGVNSLLLMQHNYANYFDIDLYSGLLTLRKQLDYEYEPYLSLTVEARDCGIGSLPAYATIEIYLIDCNDNTPEISVSFFSSLKRKKIYINFNETNNEMIGNKTDESRFTSTKIMKGRNQIQNETVIIYLNENSELNKFIAHVSITDKDSNENGRVSWMVTLNNKYLRPIVEYGNISDTSATKANTSDDDDYIRIIQLNNNSFTINTGSNIIDREKISYLNLTIYAWDHGIPYSNSLEYKFFIEIQDENDNKPKFNQTIYNISIYENNRFNEVIYKFHAIDADLNENSRIVYKLKESLNKMDEKYFTIDANTGILRAKRVFDRETRDFYKFQVIAVDNGLKQQLTGSAMVYLNILDVNDNVPKIDFNSTAEFSANIEKYFEFNKTLVLNLNENLPINSQIIQFKAIDADLGVNALSRFSILLDDLSDDGLLQYRRGVSLPFRLTDEGELYVVKHLDREIRSFYRFQVICENVAIENNQMSELSRTLMNNYDKPKLNSTLNLLVKLIDINDKCPQPFSSNINKKFIEISTINNVKNLTLFELNYTDDDDDYKNSMLEFNLLNYKDLFYLNVSFYDGELSRQIKTIHKLTVKFKPKIDVKKLKLGKYVIMIKINDFGTPKCTRINQIELFIGNEILNNLNLLMDKLKEVSHDRKISVTVKPDDEEASENKILNEYGGVNYQYDHQNYDYEIGIKMKNLFDDQHLKGQDEAGDVNVSSSEIRFTSSSIMNVKIQQQQHHETTVKSSFINYDHILLFVMGLIIVLIAVSIALLGTIYCYKKYTQIRFTKGILSNSKVKLQHSNDNNSTSGGGVGGDDSVTGRTVTASESITSSGRSSECSKDDLVRHSSSINTTDIEIDFEKAKIEFDEKKKQINKQIHNQNIHLVVPIIRQQQQDFHRQQYLRQIPMNVVTPTPPSITTIQGSSPYSYDSANMSLSVHSTNNSLTDDNSIIGSNITKETKLNNLSISNNTTSSSQQQQQQQQQYSPYYPSFQQNSNSKNALALSVSSTSTTNLDPLSSRSSNESTIITNLVNPTPQLYSYPPQRCEKTSSDDDNVDEYDDDMIVINHKPSPNLIKQFTLNNNSQVNTQLSFPNTNSYLSQKEKQIRFINTRSVYDGDGELRKSNFNTTIDTEYTSSGGSRSRNKTEDYEDDEDDDQYNEKYSFLNEYHDKIKSFKQRVYKSSEV